MCPLRRGRVQIRRSCRAENNAPAEGTINSQARAQRLISHTGNEIKFKRRRAAVRDPDRTLLVCVYALYARRCHRGRRWRTYLNLCPVLAVRETVLSELEIVILFDELHLNTAYGAQGHALGWLNTGDPVLVIPEWFRAINHLETSHF